MRIVALASNVGTLDVQLSAPSDVAYGGLCCCVNLNWYRIERLTFTTGGDDVPQELVDAEVLDTIAFAIRAEVTQ